MVEIKLKETAKYKKFEAIRKAGFDLIDCSKGYRLVDRSSKNIEQYIGVDFSSVDEALSVLAGYLLKCGYIVMAR